MTMAMAMILAMLLAPPTPAERGATFDAVRAACLDAGASEPICEALVAVTWRESRGVAEILHTRGKNEHGAGPHGIGRFWRVKLGLTVETAQDPATSTRAVLSIWRYCARRGAQRIVQLQRCYAGRSVRDDSRPHADARWCNLLRLGPWESGEPVSWAPVNCQSVFRLEELGTP